MWPVITGVFGFVIVIMLQFGIVSRTPMLSGTADLILLFVAAWSLHQHWKRFWIIALAFSGIVGFISATPFYIAVLVYMGVFLAADRLRLQVWQTPLLAMFLLTFAATLVQHALYLAVLLITGSDFSWALAFTQVTLPSLLLNMLLAIPMHALVMEVITTVNPRGVEL